MGLQFTHDGQSYRLSFERKHKNVTLVRDSREKQVKSKYPFTTVKLQELKTGLPPRLIHSATVGCFTHDTYSNEDGRRYALRSLVEYFRKNTVIKDNLESKEKHRAFAAAIWHAYLTRNEPVTPAVTVTNEQKLLPESTASAQETASEQTQLDALQTESPAVHPS